MILMKFCGEQAVDEMWMRTLGLFCGSEEAHFFCY